MIDVSFLFFWGLMLMYLLDVFIFYVIELISKEELSGKVVEGYGWCDRVCRSGRVRVDGDI